MLTEVCDEVEELRVMGRRPLLSITPLSTKYHVTRGFLNITEGGSIALSKLV